MDKVNIDMRLRKRIPASFRILGQDWRIAFVDMDKEKVFGKCDGTLGVISIGRQQGGMILPGTVLHEIIHAISMTLQINLREKQVAMLEAGLTTVFRDNPKLANALRDGKFK